MLSYRSTPTVGGQGVYIDYLTRALVDAGHRVEVLSGPPYPHLAPGVGLVKIPSLDLYAQPHKGHLALRPRHLLSWADTSEYFSHLTGKFSEPYTFGRRVYAHLRRVSARGARAPYDVLLDNQTLATGTLRVQQRLGMPMVTTIHHPITRDLRLALEAAKDWKQRWLLRRWYGFIPMQLKVAKRLTSVVCPSLAAKADVAAEFGVDPERIHAIPLGVDQSAFRPRPEIDRAPRRLVTTASSDTPLKGLAVLVEAYHRLLSDFPDLELVVIGKLRNGLAKDRIKRLGLIDRIQFRHGLPREELAVEFNRATIAVTPSLYEGFGLPAAEAMSCGAPVVVSDGGSLPEVAGRAGVVTPKGDPAALASALGGLLADPARRAEVAAACLARARTEFDWSAIAPRYVSLFERAIAQHRAGSMDQALGPAADGAVRPC
ncbi:MAG: glycosyltransferase family 4 protein [Pseudomonadota bacterium]